MNINTTRKNDAQCVSVYDKVNDDMVRYTLSHKKPVLDQSETYALNNPTMMYRDGKGISAKCIDVNNFLTKSSFTHFSEKQRLMYPELMKKEHAMKPKNVTEENKLILPPMKTHRKSELMDDYQRRMPIFITKPKEGVQDIRHIIPELTGGRRIGYPTRQDKQVFQRKKNM